MSVEDNKAVVVAFIEQVFNLGNLNRLSTFLAEEHVDHCLPAGFPPGLTGVREFFSCVHEACPDVQVTLREVVGERDIVMVWSTWRGTHRGPFLGVPASGNVVEVDSMDVYRLAGGRVVEHWGQYDKLEMLRQMGASFDPPRDPRGRPDAPRRRVAR